MSKTDYSQYTDEELISMVQDEDRYAFNEITHRYESKLLNFINGFMNNRAIAQDLVQDTLIKVWLNAHKYQPIAKFSTWTYTIARNCALTEYRKIKRRKTYSFSQLSSEDHEFKLERMRGEENRDITSDNDTFNLIRWAISELPREFQEIIIYKDIQEHSYDEISTITGLPLGTVKSRINRGRQKIREMIEQNRRNS